MSLFSKLKKQNKQFPDPDVEDIVLDKDKTDKDLIKKLLGGVSTSEEVPPDKKLGDDQQFLNDTNKQFTDLLKHYVDRQTDTYETNKPLKKEYYNLFKDVFIYSYVMFILSFFISVILYITMKEIAIFTIIIPFFLESLSITIIIPKIIARYLFNPEEEKNLSDVVSNIQKHHESVRNHQREEK